MGQMSRGMIKRKMHVSTFIKNKNVKIFMKLVIPWDACGRPQYSFAGFPFSLSTQNGKFD